MDLILSWIGTLSILMLQLAIARCVGLSGMYRGRSWRQLIRLWLGHFR